MKKNFLWLVAIFLVIGAMFLLSEPPLPSSSTNSSKVLFEGVSVDKIDSLVLESSAGSVELRRMDSRWVLPEHSNYRADAGKVRAMLLKLLSLSSSQVVAENPDSFVSFGVEDSNETGDGESPAQDATSLRLGRASFYDSDRALLASLIFGANRSGQTAGPRAQTSESFHETAERGGQYVRRSDESRVLLIAEPVTLQTKISDWIETTLVNVLRSNIVVVDQYQVLEGSESESDRSMKQLFSIERKNGTESAADNFRLIGAKKSDNVSDAELVLIASALENLRFADVYPETADLVGNLKWDRQTRFTLASGLRYQVTTALKGEKVFARIAIEFSPRPAGASVNASEEEDSKAGAEAHTSAPTAPGAAQNGIAEQSSPDAATQLSAQYQGWIYELPAFTGQKLRREKKELFQSQS